MPSNNNTPTARYLRSNSQTEVTLANIRSLIETSKNEIILSIRSEIQNLKESITSLTGRVEKLEEENALLKQQQLQSKNENAVLRSLCNSIEERSVAADINSRKNTFIIRNFPEDERAAGGENVDSCLEAVSAVAKALGLSDRMSEVGEAYRFGKTRGRRLIMVKTTESISKQFLRRARHLKRSDAPLNQVFVQENLPPLINKRLADMRKRAFEHRKSHPGEEAFVKNKKLYLNGVMVAEINQNF